MTKRVSETAAGRSISALIVLRKNGEHVATVQIHYGESVVSVDIWNHVPRRGRPNPTREAMDKARDWNPSHGRAGGYGYDKLTAALAGLEIDGIRLSDHCGECLPYPRGLDHFPEGFKPPAGFRLANYRREVGGWVSCYRDPGLRFLEARGYRVIQAI
jgi:hypothetical protein